MEKYINSNSFYIKNGTQENMILNYIKDNGYITTLIAVRDLGILQAPARIWGLKRRGINIKTRRKQVVDRYGDTKRIVEYYIEEGEQAI
jgi:hypothetical protein